MSPPLPARCRVVPAALELPVRETSPPASPRCGLPDCRAVPSLPRRLQYNLPARCDAPRDPTSIRPASGGEATFRPADCNDGHDAAGSRTVAGAPDAACAPLPNALAQYRGSLHAPDPEPRPRSVHRLGAAWQD